MKAAIIATLGLLLSLAESIVYAQSDKALPAIALTGGTLIDLSNSGHRTHDIPNAIVVLRDGKIEAAEPAALVKIPKDARVIVLVHMTRYVLGLIPSRLQEPLVQDPDGAALAPAYAYLRQLDVGDPSIAAYAKEISASRAALMPTLSLSYNSVVECPRNRQGGLTRRAGRHSKKTQRQS
jgi:hypothetical protein